MAEVDAKPNIIFILADDLGPWALESSGNEEIITPNLTELSKSGINFENFFCTSPVCSPARASILTGKIPSQHGVHDWIREGNKGLKYLNQHQSYTDILAEAGYKCGISGKWHLGDSFTKQKSFEHWFVHQEGGGPYYNAPMVENNKAVNKDRYLTDIITEDAIKFIEQEKQNDNPFCLNINYTAPHSPWDYDQHPDKYLDIYKNCKFKSIPNLPRHKWQREDVEYPLGARRKEVLSCYFAAVTAMDYNIGKIISKLEELKIRENTIIVFSSDNGMNMGHHGIFGKGNGTFPQNMYDSSVKVPMMISMPGAIKAGKISEVILSHYDFMPTILDYLNIDHHLDENLPGKSFARILKGDEIAEDEKEVVVFDEYGPVRMIRNKKWKYVHRYPYGPNELYDLENDIKERNNLVEKKKYEDIISRMRYKLDKWFIKYADPALDGSREDVYGRGQKNLAGIKARGNSYFKYKESKAEEDFDVLK